MAVESASTVVWVQLISSCGTVAGLIVVGWFQRKTREDAQATRAAVTEQGNTLAAVATNVNGHLSEVKKIADTFAAEVVRLQVPGTTTPYGDPSSENPVTLSAGVPTVAKPARSSTEGGLSNV